MNTSTSPKVLTSGRATRRPCAPSAGWPIDRPRRPRVRRSSSLGRRVQQGSTALYYSADWQVLEERDGGGIARVSMVWSPVYIDAVIARDRDSDSNGSLEERLYVAHDANFNVSSILNTSGSAVERFLLDPYGSPTFLDAAWSVIGSSAYAWTHLHQGGWQSAASSLCHFRHREFSPTLGRWMTNDPIHFRAKDFNLYRAYSGNALSFNDASGLAAYHGDPKPKPGTGSGNPNIDCGPDASAPVPPDIGHPPRPRVGFCYWSIASIHGEGYECGGSWLTQDHGIRNLEAACERLRTTCNQRCQRLVISGHGALPLVGFSEIAQGCWMNPGFPPRLVVTPDLQRAARCLQAILPGDAYVQMGACHTFPGNPPAYFGACLKALARLMDRKVCACVGCGLISEPDCRTRCTGKWCCAQP